MVGAKIQKKHEKQFWPEMSPNGSKWPQEVPKTIKKIKMGPNWALGPIWAQGPFFYFPGHPLFPFVGCPITYSALCMSLGTAVPLVSLVKPVLP